MPSLLDIAPPELVKRQVDIRGTPVDVEGVPADVWMQLYHRYPVLASIVQGQAGGAAPLAALEAQAALIAAGTGHPLDRKHEKAAMRLTTEEQQKLVGEIIEISMPGEIFSPLLESSELLGPALVNGGAEPGGKGPGSK